MTCLTVDKSSIPMDTGAVGKDTFGCKVEYIREIGEMVCILL
jgi:hypothetical protein